MTSESEPKRSPSRSFIYMHLFQKKLPFRFVENKYFDPEHPSQQILEKLIEPEAPQNLFQN